MLSRHFAKSSLYAKSTKTSVYEGQTGRYITRVLRVGKTPTAQEIICVLKRIVRRIRKAWLRSAKKW